jgi:ribosome maturation protein SDO1
MPYVEARLKVKGKHFEISVDFDEAMKIKTAKGGDIVRALNSDAIYHDLKKAEAVPKLILENCFNTSDLHIIAAEIIKRGEILKPQEFREAERENKIKRIIGMILRNAVDQKGRPFTEDILKRAVEQVHYNFDNRPDDAQMNDLVNKLKPILPIRIEKKKIKLVVPARFTGQIYGLLKDYKESEEWLANGNLEVVVSLPAGMQIDFYEKLNAITHGAVVSEEIK